MCAECFEQTRQHLEHDRLTRGPERRVAIMQQQYIAAAQAFRQSLVYGVSIAVDSVEAAPCPAREA